MPARLRLLVVASCLVSPVTARAEAPGPSTPSAAVATTEATPPSSPPPARANAPKVPPSASPAATGHDGKSDPRHVVLDAMRAELDRSIARLRLDGYENPYFIAYAVRDDERADVTAKLGAVFADGARRERHAWVKVRVGDYAFDNTSNDSSPGAFDLDGPEGYEPPTQAPLDDDGRSLRATLWLLTDNRYKQGLADYARRRGQRVTELREDGEQPSFSREAPSVSLDEPQPAPFDRAAAAARARKASALFADAPDLFDGTVKLGVERMVRYLVTSEGTRVVTERAIYSVLVTAATRAKDGMLLEHEKAFYGATPAELPDDAGLAAAIAELSGELRALREAPVVDPYTGPVILMQQAAGVFFHEAIGHRLEGERQNSEKEGRTFKGQIGQRILPEFLSVHDDPTQRSIVDSSAPSPRRVSLNGYYRQDDEGVPARDVTLIDHGVLRDYLMSRTPIKGSLHSNGHGRADGANDPMGRMANLIVRSGKQVPAQRLKQLLLDEVRRQGKPYGLMVRDITGGATNTSNFGFQAFKGEPRLVYRVDAKTGKETLVRGVELVGTPLASINKIVATSDTVGVFNGFCGAESGFVPVSTVAPAVLMTEIELQRSERALERQPILPPPFADRAH